MSADIPAVQLARTARTMLVSYKAASLVFALLLRFLAKALHETSSALGIAHLYTHRSLPAVAKGLTRCKATALCQRLQQPASCSAHVAFANT